MRERDQDNFDTADLHEQKNTRQVQIALLALGRIAYSIPGYAGPCVGKKPVAAAPSKKHTKVKIEGLWGKAGGNAPKAGYTQPVGEVDTSTSVRPSANPSKVRFKRVKSPTVATKSHNAQSAGATDDGDRDGDDDTEMDFEDLDALMDSSPIPGDHKDEGAAGEAATLADLKQQMVLEQERVAAMEQKAAEIKRAAEAEAAAIREAAVEQARLEAARIATEATDAATNQDEDNEPVDDAAEKAAAAAELKAAAAARAKEKQVAAGERPPPNPDWVRPASAPATGPYPGSYDLQLPVDELACAWISEVTGLPTATLDDLRDGVALCELCNVLTPGAVKRINRSSMPFPQVSVRRILYQRQ